MKLTLEELFAFADVNNLGMETEIKINGCELHHLFVSNGTIYLDETEDGENECRAGEKFPPQTQRRRPQES